MQYSQIIWAAFFGFFFFDEAMDRETLIGSAIIIVSGIYIVLREDRGGRSTNTPVLRSRTRVGLPTVPRVAAFLSADRRGPQRRPPFT
jgi:hypothetical protein